MFTQQEEKIIAFLKERNEAFYEELAQFCKKPTEVKLNTIKKIISDIKKKCKDYNIECPFTTKLSLIDNKANQEKIVVNGQSLTKIQRPLIIPDTVKQCQKDFTIIKYNRQIRSKQGVRTLNEDDFFVFEYMYANPEKVISLDELRDKVVFPQYGSKLPARWWDVIQRRINNIRRAIPELSNRLLTVKIGANGTGYLFQ